MAGHLRFYCILEGCGTERLRYLLLPELDKCTAQKWWKEAIEEMVENRFPALLENENVGKIIKESLDRLEG